MHRQIKTLVGDLDVVVFPVHDRPDSVWWAMLEEPPTQLRHGGPKVASGASPDTATTLLEDAIRHFVLDDPAPRSAPSPAAASGRPRILARAHTDPDGRWVVDIPSSAMTASGNTYDEAVALAADTIWLNTAQPCELEVVIDADDHRYAP